MNDVYNNTESGNGCHTVGPTRNRPTIKIYQHLTDRKVFSNGVSHITKMAALCSTRHGQTMVRRAPLSTT